MGVTSLKQFKLRFLTSMRNMNPYREANRISRERRGLSWNITLVLLGIITATIVIRPIFFSDWQNDLGVNLESLLFRFSALIASAMALHTYSSVVRSSEHGIISLHPILGRQFLWASLEEALRSTWIWWFGSAIILFPLIELGEYFAYILSILLLLGAWIGGIGVGYCVNLGSIWVARSSAFHPILDMARGQNPREQAAFIYAPGVALLLVGLGLAFASGGLRATLSGNPIWGLLILLPYLLGGAGFVLALSLVEEELLRVGTILTEIDAHWGAVEEGDDPNAVYLDWLANGRPEFLRALRAGWREYRLYPVLSWGVGILSGLMIWAEKLNGGLSLGALGFVGLGTLTWQLRGSDPEWLDRALGVNERKVALARLQLVLAYGMGIIIPVFLIGLLKQGMAFLESGLLLLGIGLCLSVGSVLLSKNLAYYLPMAFLAWAFLLRVL